jgi:hypothetical protein
MAPTEVNHFLLLSQLSRAERVALAGRCARIAVQLLDSMSLPVALKQMGLLEEVVRLAEVPLQGLEDLFKLQSAMQKLKQLAFATLTECKYPSDSVIFHGVRAANAAGMTAFTGSSLDAQEALESAFAVARIAVSKPAEDLLVEELRRARMAALAAVGIGTQTESEPTRTSSAGA